MKTLHTLVLAVAIVLAGLGLAAATPESALAGSSGCSAGTQNPYVQSGRIYASGWGRCSVSAGEVLTIYIYQGSTIVSAVSFVGSGFISGTESCVVRYAGPYYAQTRAVLTENYTGRYLAGSWSAVVYVPGHC